MAVFFCSWSDVLTMWTYHMQSHLPRVFFLHDERICLLPEHENLREMCRGRDNMFLESANLHMWHTYKSKNDTRTIQILDNNKLGVLIPIRHAPYPPNISTNQIYALFYIRFVWHFSKFIAYFTMRPSSLFYRLHITSSIFPKECISSYTDSFKSLLTFIDLI